MTGARAGGSAGGGTGGVADRWLRQPADLERLAFDDRGLLPVIAQEAGSGEVLMLAWANAEALTMALDTGYMHYWSRSRASLWKKGETSGHLQRLVSLHDDCDSDAVLARVRQEGPACHTGDDTCFGELPDGAGGDGAAGGAASEGDGVAAGGTVSAGDGAAGGGAVLDALWATLASRNRERPEGSWTTRLLEDPNLRLKKLGEETVELVHALLTDPDRAPEEAADLVYHVMVALLAEGRSWSEVMAELERRRG